MIGTVVYREGHAARAPLTFNTFQNRKYGIRLLRKYGAVQEPGLKSRLDRFGIFEGSFNDVSHDGCHAGFAMMRAYCIEQLLQLRWCFQHPAPIKCLDGIWQNKAFFEFPDVIRQKRTFSPFEQVFGNLPC